MTNNEDKNNNKRFSLNDLKSWLDIAWKVGGLIAIFLIAYYGLDKRISVAEQKVDQVLMSQERVLTKLESINCNSRQFSNFMIYGIKPKLEDRCQ